MMAVFDSDLRAFVMRLNQAMHVHLDPVGGISGDMFAAALLDAWPEWEPRLLDDLRRAGPIRVAQLARHTHHDHALTGSRLEVREIPGGPKYLCRNLADIRKLFSQSTLAPPVIERALAIFELLGRAESRVHGVPLDEVVFHEIGAWDSIMDIVTAAWLIETLSAASWSCAPLPMGRGRIVNAHGELPVPAPATVVLLEGFPLFQDEYEGERVTPTGAAILRYLDPNFTSMRTPLRLNRCGMGFGKRAFSGLSNILRVFIFDDVQTTAAADQVVVCRFEVDDQTPEDLAVALEQLRAVPGVLDVFQSPVYGKKGRLGAQIEILANPERLDKLLKQCFSETSTLGVRWQIVRRAVIERGIRQVRVSGQSVRVKRAKRPDYSVTDKAEMADIANATGGYAGRERLRRLAQDAALEADEAPLQNRSND